MAQSPSKSADKAAAAAGQTTRQESGDARAPRQSATLAEKLETARSAPSPAGGEDARKGAKDADDRSVAPTQPARKRVAANDDLPSIGGLIYALQQRPSRSPFIFAFAASLIWLLIGGAAGWAMTSANIATISGIGDFLRHPVALAAGATVIIPIALFWFLALLIWRAQELRLMASAMTEVAVRLAEPDKMAEQSVASLGQTIRRQVAAMNDAISRALGRAGELEALVHNEVAALENSYGDNEMRIRRLIDELSSEREALANNSERVSEALRGVGSHVTKDIATAGQQVTQSLATATSDIAESLTAKSGKITAAMTAAGTAIDNKLAERGTKLTEAIQATSQKASDAVDVKANALFQSLSTVSEKLSKDVPSLLERLDGEQKRLNTIIAAANQNFTALETAVAQRATQMDTTLKQRAEQITTSLEGHATQMDAALKKRTEQITTSLDGHATQMDAALKKRADELKASLAERINALDGTIRKQAETMEQSLNKGTMALNQAFAESADAVKRNSTQMAQNSSHATENMKAQADMLKQVSDGMLQQIHGLTQRFEKQGQAIMTAANALDSSNAKIDSILERRHSEISSLLDMVSNKAQDLDKMMRSYTGIIESSLVHVEARAKELSAALVQESTAQSRATIDEIERLRADARRHTNKTVQELQASFGAINKQVADQLGVLTQQFGKTTREMRTTANQTVGEIESTRQELQRRMRDLPQETRQSTEAMRKAVSDQLLALDSLSAIASEHQGGHTGQAAPSLPPNPYGAARNGNGTAPTSQLPLRGPALQPPGYGQQPPAPEMRQPHARPEGPYDNGRRYDNGAQEDLSAITSNLAQRLAAGTTVQHGHRYQAAPSPNGAGAERTSTGGVRITGGPPQGGPAEERWSVGDLLARASQPDDSRGFAPGPQPGPSPHSAPRPTAGSELRLTELARAVDQRTAADIWQRFQRGERDIFSRQLYTHEGQAAFDEISMRYQQDPEFRGTVDRYIGDFERLLAEADSKGQDPAIIQNYLTSETGRVYLMLAHASGRLH